MLSFAQALEVAGHSRASAPRDRGDTHAVVDAVVRSTNSDLNLLLPPIPWLGLSIRVASLLKNYPHLML